jgi:hypothetical protein
MPRTPLTEEEKAAKRAARLAANLEKRASKENGNGAAPFVEAVRTDAPAADLSDAEIRQIEAEEEERARAEAKKARVAEFRVQAKERARRKAGLIPPATDRDRHMAELVSVYISLPALRGPGGRRIEPQPIMIDQRFFMPNRSYNVTRAQAQTLMAMMGQAWVHAEQVQGQSRAYVDESGRVMHQGGYANGSGAAA